MIKLIIFDLDGVLVDSKEIHFSALNVALAEVGSEYVISRDDHLLRFDGLPTSKKLQLLTRDSGLPEEVHQRIFERKQQETLRLIEQLGVDERIKAILSKLKARGFLIYCATNSIRHTAKLQLMRRGFFDYIDYLFSNEDVLNAKPHPEIYLRCMVKAQVGPMETLIVEDSLHGRRGARESGARLCGINNPESLGLELIEGEIQRWSDNTGEIHPWEAADLTVLIPMAGAGSRFRDAGYTFPKPLIEVHGKPMIQVVVENLNIKAKYVFVVSKRDHEEFKLSTMLSLIAPGCKVVTTEALTEGAACSALIAREHIDNSRPLLIANSDQFVRWSSSEFMYSMLNNQVDGGIASFKSTHPKWSFAKVGERGLVEQVAEKIPISNNATVGIYFWKKGSDFVLFAEQMIEKNIRTRGEFYICPVYNEAIAAGKKIKIYPVEKMWGLGTPEDLQTFLLEKT